MLRAIPAKDEKLLTIVWMISCFIPEFPHFLLIINGAHGSGKSVLTRWIKYITDPSKLDTMILAKDQNTVIQTLNHHWVVGFDNIILATTDGGENWVIQHKRHSFIPGSIILKDILFITEYEGWAVGSYGIHYTENGGKTWNRLPNTAGPGKITFANDTHGWAVAKRKDQSFFTKTGGTPPLNATFVNTGVGVIILSGILISFLIVGALKKNQHK